MASSSITVRVDEDVKRQAESLFEDIGMNMSTAINIFIKAAIRQGGIPFIVSNKEDPFYSPKNQEHLKRAAERMENTGGQVHEIIDMDNEV